MTAEFQDMLEDYLVNNFNTTDPMPKTEFDEINVQNPSVWSNFLPTNYSDIHYVGSVIDSVSNNVIIYGYYTQENVDKGIITILDGTFTPIKSFFTYNDGTTINPVQCLKQAEDGTYYLIDKTTNLRFVMVNNFSAENRNGQYVLDLRKSYNFDSSFNNYIVREMYKSGTSSDYLFFSTYEENIKATELKVNVGEANEWNTITITDKRFGGGYALFNDDGVFWRMITVSPPSLSNNNVVCYTKNYTSTTTTQTVLNTFTFVPRIQTALSGQCVFVDQNNIYFVLHEVKPQTSPWFHGRIGLYKYSFDDNSFTTIYYKDLVGVEYDENIALANLNSVVYISYNTNIKKTSGVNYADYYFQRLVDDEWAPVEYKTNQFFEMPYYLLAGNVSYNLVQLYSFCFTENNKYVLLIKDNYNVLNYNGLPFTDYNSMLPKQAELYSNNSLVFARNIIDKTIIDNKTISNVIIPNTYLNNISLSKQNLLSETNIEMIGGIVQITKNIYESIYLNFINNIKSRVVFADGSSSNFNAQIPSNLNSYVNENINIGTKENANNISMRYVVINYEDETTITNPIDWQKTGDAYRYDLVLDVQKEIISYEIKSNDLQQIYLQVFPTSLEVGNVYKITHYFYVKR